MTSKEPTGEDGTSASSPNPVTRSDDEQRLHELGYAQELERSMSPFSNMAVSMTIICILSGALTLYGFGMNTGGPVIMVWGWPIVGLFSLIVGLGMAEVCSSYPTAGGLYYWAAKLAKNNAPEWAWFTGWFNFLGQVAVTAGIDFGLAQFLNAFLSLQFGFDSTPRHTVALFGIALVIHALLNVRGVRLVAILNNISVWWQVIGVAIVVLALSILPDHHQSAKFVFTHFTNNTGWTSTLYVCLLGLLLAQYTFTGFDASAHMTEETHNAAIAGPRGIVNSIIISLVAGWILLIGVTFAIQDYDGALASSTGVPPVQIFLDALGATGGKLLLLIVIGAQFFCGMSSVTANSRMVYAFSRDGALPGSAFWHHISTRTRTPTHAIWLCAGGAFLLGLPYLINPTAYGAVTSIAVIGLYIAYVIPVFLRLRLGSEFVAGPWQLGRWSRLIGIIGVAWVAFITVLFMLPQSSPIGVDSFNYAPIAVLVVLGFAWIYWVVSAHKWFTGPKVQGSAEELSAIERDLEVF